MSSLIPVVFMVVIGCLWFTTAFLNQSLIKAIATKPELLRQFPEAGERSRSPRKFVFFLSASSKELLAKYPGLLRRRNQFFWLVIASALVPPVLFFCLFASH